ncbi:hypothetical protein Astex_0027 [Asticcacaulis excentricus CB 48]|uniref:Uncharacterized protein n=1 Tax=Asticcacaulis excentricus (strain ATCC 15261 / DSM 4724 / KCTC 12464 / NCIMB 9791 / VKM B-1370 / CB 48) TaxID=573065 RepID=E8RMW8_ASTEC|nr:hypothetical protein Astex_0027 [Asticcacaulis excentricus CB 48]
MGPMQSYHNGSAIISHRRRREKFNCLTSHSVANDNPNLKIQPLEVM